MSILDHEQEVGEIIAEIKRLRELSFNRGALLDTLRMMVTQSEWEAAVRTTEKYLAMMD